MSDDQSKAQRAMSFAVFGSVFLISSIATVSFVAALSFILFFSSLVSSIIAVVMSAAIKKQDPSDKKARTANTIGWINLVILIIIGLLMILLATELSHWGEDSK